MKRLAVTISLILTIVLALSFFYVNRATASKAPPPSVQMLSTSYGITSGFTLPITPITVETLSFSVTAPAKLEVTSLNTSLNFPASCQIVLDGGPFSMLPPVSPSSHPDVTATDTSVASGSHTLTVVCQANSISSAYGSLSAIITTGL